MFGLSLSSPVTRLPLIGPSMAGKLERLGVGTIHDFLSHIPSRYEDLSKIVKIDFLQAGETVTISGTVRSIRNIFTPSGFILQKAEISDETGTIEALWFNQRFLTKSIHKGDKINLAGKAELSGKSLVFKSPDYELLTTAQPLHTGRLVAIYPETQGVSSKWFRRQIRLILNLIEQGSLEIAETLPEQILKRENLCTLKESYFQIHFPQSLDQATDARRRLCFEELLISQVLASQRKATLRKTKAGHSFKIVEVRPKMTKFIQSLPFSLTLAQKRVINEINQDLSQKIPMNRLLQGDVGSGKTVVAALAMLAAHLNGFQSVLMAPTEILANQHQKTISKLLAPLKIKVGIATGSKKIIDSGRGQNDIIVGTHALLSENLTFKKLGLIVIDEQHRFGVEQRAILSGKGDNPHILTMTATPIPRTVALTLYGDLDMSVLTNMPKNRLSVKTWVVPDHKREAAYAWINKKNSQTFIICPFIEESETLNTVRAATTEYERVKTIFPGKKIGLVHGRLKNRDKILNEFRNQKLDILVATPIVEVGIDIPTAEIMIIEGADRFGLAQLHQLRGRVGRGDRQSYCLLFTDDDSPGALKRLKYLETQNSGLKLAEFDLALRGPGQRFGFSQHGQWDLKIADFSDLPLIEQTHQLAGEIISNPLNFPLLMKNLQKSRINIANN